MVSVVPMALRGVVTLVQQPTTRSTTYLVGFGSAFSKSSPGLTTLSLGNHCIA
jgi:hypothetical protein